MNTITNTIIKFLCKHCRTISVDTFYQVCESFSKIQRPEKVVFYAKIWRNHKMKAEEKKNA